MLHTCTHTHGSYVCALTHSSARLLSSKKKTHEVVLCVFTQVRVSVFRCVYTYTCPSFPTHRLAHTPFTLKPIPILTHTFAGVVLAEGEQQWSGTGLFFSAGQSLARPKGGSHPIPSGVPLVGTRLNHHLLGELHFRYIVQAPLNGAEGRWDIMLKSTLPDQSAFCAGL